MANFESVLAGIPGYGGYLAKDQLNRRNTLSDLQQVQGAQGLMAQMQQQQMAQGIRGVLSDTTIPEDQKIQKLAQFGEPGMKVAGTLAQMQKQQVDLQKEKDFRAGLAGLGENPTQEQLVGLASKFGSPDKVISTHQASLDRAAQREVLVANKQAELEARVEAARQRGADQRELAQMRIDAAKDLKAFGATLAAGMRQPPAVTPVTIADPNDPTGAGTIVIDGRTRAVLGQGPKLTQTGAADQKTAAGLPAARARVASMDQNLTRLDEAMAELEADPGLTNITGTIAGRTPNLTNQATGAQAKLDSIKSQIFVSALQSMREASKTGGAVGNVSNREGDKLENTLAALGQAQSTEDFKKQLAKARQQLRLSQEIIKNAYDEQYGSMQPKTAPAGGGGWSVVR